MADSNSGIWLLIGALGLGGILAYALSKRKSSTTSISGCTSCSKR